MSEYLERTRLLVGEEALTRLQRATVAVAGLGGVGGHCAEALARAGVGRLILIDFDTVAPSNLNRQLVATKRTVGRGKAEAMAERIRDVSDCEAVAVPERITNENAEALLPADTDFLVDAIDNLTGKLALIETAARLGMPMISCMGAGNRLDPMGFAVRDVFSTKDCPLARNLRRELRRRGIERLPVVASEELPHAKKGQTVIGSFAPVTAAAGLLLASYALHVLMHATES